MKVLFLAFDHIPDFHQDLVCHGLAEVVGPENVLVYPQFDRYHEPPPIDVKQTAMSWPKLPRAADAGLEELAAEADVVVVGALRGSALDAFSRIVELGVDKPRAALDGLDDPYYREAIRHVDVYFKRETLAHPLGLRLKFPLRRVVMRFRDHGLWGPDSPLRRQIGVAQLGVQKLVPLPFAAVPVAYPKAPVKEYDVGFLGAATHPIRTHLVEAVRDLRAEGLRVLVPDERLSEDDRYRWESRRTWFDYMRVLSASRIAISVRGDGFDTYRYWEIPYAGAMLLSETPRTVIPDNFVDGVEAVFAEPEQLTAEARRLLESDDVESIAAAGHAKLMAKHLSRHRAEVVLERLASVRPRRAPTAA